MISNILSSIICETFEKEVGWSNPDKVFRINFETIVDYYTEKGFRYVELLIYAPNNYVQVWEREMWDVLPVEDLYYNEEEDELRIKSDSPGYRKGTSGWYLKARHDSCWRQDGVQRFVQENKNRMQRAGVVWTHWYHIETFDPSEHPSK